MECDLEDVAESGYSGMAFSNVVDVDRFDRSDKSCSTVDRRGGEPRTGAVESLASVSE